MNARIFLGGLSLAAALTLTACGGSSGGETGGTGGTAGGGATTLSVAADAAQLKYAQTTLEATAGQPITVNFNNPSTALPHNWVLVPQGQEDAVVTAALPANGDATGLAGVLAAGKPITGSQETINVPAQPAGTYSFICTVPGHYQSGMKGVLTVK
ncbi:MAG TPA: plastocyanin/azurin family copper-binding protein [Herpetosiphonaceae bacterium]